MENVSDAVGSTSVTEEGASDAVENVSDAVGSAPVTEEGASDAVENVSDAVGSASVSRRRAPLMQWRMSLMRLGAILSHGGGRL